jgi:hypothetical protein
MVYLMGPGKRVAVLQPSRRGSDVSPTTSALLTGQQGTHVGGRHA